MTKLKLLRTIVIILSVIFITPAYAGDIHNACMSASQALLKKSIGMACGDAAAVFDGECSAALIEIEEYGAVICGGSAFAVKQACSQTLTSAIVGPASAKVCKPVKHN